MENSATPPSPEAKTIKVIATSPITWLPLTGAFAIACLLPIPWWTGTVIVGATVAVIVGFWRGNAEKLYNIYKAQESFEKQTSHEQAEKDLLQNLCFNGYDAASGNLRRIWQKAGKIQELIAANPWLETHDFGTTTRALVADLQSRAQSLLDEPAENKSTHGRGTKETFLVELQALGETLENIEQMLQEHELGTDTPAESAAEKLKKVNEISRKARESARKAIEDTKQS